MDSTSAFDFSNEGDCFLANESLKTQSIPLHYADISSDSVDSVLLRACSDIMYHDIEMTEQQMDLLKRYSERQTPSIMPFIDVIDMNRADEDLVNSITPNPAVVIGVKGEF